MPLTNLNFCNGTPCNITPSQLQFSGQGFLCHTLALSYCAYIITNFCFNFVIHICQVFTFPAG